MSSYVITNVDPDGVTVFLIDGFSQTPDLARARTFGSRVAAADYCRHFGLHGYGWMVDSVKRFEQKARREVELR